MVAERRNSPFERAAVDIEGNGFEQVALRDRGDGARNFGGGPDQVVDQGIDGVFHLAPSAARRTKFNALFGFPVAADDLADALKLHCHALIGGDDVIKGIGDLAFDADAIAGHANGKIPAPHGLKGDEKFDQNRRYVVGCLGGRYAVGDRRGS